MIAPPKTTPEYMYGAWIDCLVWAVSNDKVIDQYKRDTKSGFVPPNTPIERMIDEATGHGKAEVEKFVEWFNVNIWGDCT